MKQEIQKALQKVVDAQRVASEAERKLLLLLGWEEQGTYDGITWWYQEGASGSEPQRIAIRYAIKALNSSKPKINTG